MSLEVGKTYHFEGQTHKTIFVAVSTSELTPWFFQVLILESDGGLVSDRELYAVGSTMNLHVDSKMAKESVPL